jgi:hypothetical protein
VQKALSSTLRDPAGVWVLSNHKDGFSERALTSWQDELSNVRLDRVFRAGHEPFAPGEDYLWIVDYKTTPYTSSAKDEFLAREQEKYAAQLETYARTMLDTVAPASIRLGLYYPLLPGLTWWALESE